MINNPKICNRNQSERNNLVMRKIIIQIILILCVVVESFLIFKILITPAIIYQELYTGLAILIMLVMIRLINNLTNIAYGNPEEN